MAKKSSIEKNKRRAKLAKQYAAERARLKAIANNETLSMEERFTARLKLAELPRNSAIERVRNSLRGDRPSARQLPQAQDVAYRVARARLQGADPRPRQVELVRR